MQYLQDSKRRKAQNPWVEMLLGPRRDKNGARSLRTVGSVRFSLLGPLLFVLCKIEDIATVHPAAQNKLVSCPNEVNPRHRKLPSEVAQSPSEVFGGRVQWEEVWNIGHVQMIFQF